MTNRKDAHLKRQTNKAMKAFFNSSSFLLLLLLLCLPNFLLASTSFSPPENKEKAQYKYSFIKEASTFSSSSSTSSSSSSRSKGGKLSGYDYIIVGGGTTGCPLAATLSQKFKVLVLERGGVPFQNVNVSYLDNFHISLADTSPHSASQFFISTDGVFNARARVLGGGSCINAGFYSRPSHRYVKRAGWDEELVNESYPWVENQIVQRPKLAPWQRAIRDSLIEIGVSPFNGYTFDHKYGTKVGGTTFEKNGRRRTAAELLSSANPKKITVLIHATVQKITFNTKGKKPRAKGVIFKDENGKEHEVLLSRRKGSDIIVSSGAIGSPQMLLLSGIGPKQDLKKMNITVVMDNEFVGKDMQDNPMNSIFVPTDKQVTQSLIQTVGITKMGLYIEASSGFGQSQDSIQCHHGIASAEIGQLSTIPPKQRTKEAIEAYKKRKHDLPFEAFRGGFILEKIAKAKSRGELKLANTNVDDNPSVTFNYFSHPRDLKRCVQGIKVIEKILKSKAFSNYTGCDKETMDQVLKSSVKANVNLIPKHTNDTRSLEQFCKDTVVTIWHYHGGCRVGKVVGPDYRVLGVDNMRVIDGSTFYESPGTNPQATIMMLGRYMGVKIIRERLGKATKV